MKNFMKIVLIGIAVFSFTFSVSGQHMRKNIGVMNNVPVNPSNIVMLKGQVQAVMTEIPVAKPNVSRATLAITKARIRVKETGIEYIVQLAPASFMTTQGLNMNRNDIVSIKAFRTFGSAELKTMTVQKEGKVFILRDQFGRGIWEKQDAIRPGRDIKIR